MKKFRCLLLLLAMFVCVIPLACGQMGLFDLASNGARLIYVVARYNDGIDNNVLIVSSGNDYYQEYLVNNLPNSIECFIASENGNAIIGFTPGFYLSDDNYQQWDSDSTVFFPGGTKLFSYQDSIIAINSGNIYKRDKAGWSGALGPFASFGSGILPENEDSLYNVKTAVSGIEKYEISTDTLDGSYNTAPDFLPAWAAPDPINAFKCGSAFYIGNINTLYVDTVNSGKSGGTFNLAGPDFTSIIAGTIVQSYEISGCSEIFAGTIDPSNLLHLYRLQSSTWIDQNLAFTAESGANISIFEFTPGSLVLWIKHSTQGGIYIYNYNKKQLRKIDRIPPAYTIYKVQVM